MEGEQDSVLRGVSTLQCLSFIIRLNFVPFWFILIWILRCFSTQVNYCFFVDSCFMSLKVIRIFSFVRVQRVFPAFWPRATPSSSSVFCLPSNFRAERVLCNAAISTGYCAIFKTLPSSLYEKKKAVLFFKYHFFNMKINQIITPLTPPNFDQNMKKRFY